MTDLSSKELRKLMGAEAWDDLRRRKRLKRRLKRRQIEGDKILARQLKRESWLTELRRRRAALIKLDKNHPNLVWIEADIGNEYRRLKKKYPSQY